jgi:hypothetical protein
MRYLIKNNFNKLIIFIAGKVWVKLQSELHKIIAGIKGLDTYLFLKVQQLITKPSAFKPMPISRFVNQKPHLFWYLRRYEKRIIELGITGSLLVTLIILLIKNWR